MKQFYLLIITLFIGFNSYSQLELTNTANGVVSVSYGASADWTLYDPGVDPVVLYLWVSESMNSLNNFYGDDWNGTLINLTWNGSAHVGTINLNSYNFNNGGVIPVGTTVNDFNLILRNPGGSSQSSDLTATTYGYSLSVLPVEEFSSSNLEIFTTDNKINLLGLQNNEKYILRVFDTMGRLIKNISTTENQIDISELKASLYFTVLKTSNGSILRKKIIKQ